jgi:hypothetical protein
LAGLGGALIMSTAANAAFTGLSVFLEGPGGAGAPPTGGPRVIYRVYANFDNATDRVNAWGAGSTFGPGSILNVDSVDSGPGTGFTNIGGAGGQIAPYSGGTTRDWDTYMTVGLLYGAEGPAGADATSQIPATPVFITNGATSWAPDPVNGGGVFVTPDDPQGGASYRVSGNDTDHRVLLMQLVVNAGQNVKGTIGVAWQAAGQAGVTVAGQTFTSVIPAPGALALLGLAGMVGARRRRA